jgi:CubicO group peptidase (beta-lactamase class C family)
MTVLWFSIPLMCSEAETRIRVDTTLAQTDIIDAYVTSRMREQRIPGIGLGIVDHDRVIHVAGFGVADPSGRPVNANTPFILGSLSKSFTALAIMQLVESGHIQLSSKVCKYIPWFTLAEDSSQYITVRQLLNHTSGISVTTSEKFAASSDISDDALEHRVRALRTEHLDRPVGSEFEYSGTNYAILGLIVQLVSGQTYENYLQEHIFNPLKMEHTYTSQSDAEQHGLAKGYLYWFFFPRATELPFNRGSLPQGYIISCAADMCHYLIAQLNGGRFGDTQILSSSGISEMHRPAVETWKPGTSYGIGWEIGPIAGIPAIWHEGSIFNYHANMVLLPEKNLGFVVLENIYSGLDEERMNQIPAGIALLLTGGKPPPIASSRPLLIAYAILFLVLFGQLWYALGVLRRLILRKVQLHINQTILRLSMLVLAALVNLGWGLLIVLGIPFLFGMPLITTASRIPDFGYVLLISAFLAFSTTITLGLKSFHSFTGYFKGV